MKNLEDPRPVPGSPEAERLALEWESTLNSETRTLLDSDPNMRTFWHDMDPEIRSVLTYCNTPCIPVGISPENVTSIGELMHRLRIPSNHRGLREYLHIFRSSDSDLARAIRALDSINTLGELEMFLDNELIKLIQRTHGVIVRRRADGLWEYPRPDGTVITEFKLVLTIS